MTLPPAHAARFAALRAEPSTDAARDPARLARVERTREELLVQGAAIAATLAAAAPALAKLGARLAHRTLTEVVIAGCGDSWFAGMAARPAFRARLGLPCSAAEAYDYATYEADQAGPGTLLFGLSASGTTAAVNEALARARARGAFTVGLSNVADSALMRDADAGLVAQATRRGWPTQSTTAAIALLLAAAESIATARGESAELTAPLAALPESVDAVVTQATTPMRKAGSAVARAAMVTFAGAGPFFAAASIGAAKLRELGPIHAIAAPLEELQHYRAQKRGDPLVLLAPDAASRPRALDAAVVGHVVGGRTTALLGAEDREIAGLVERHMVLPASHPLLAPLLWTIPLQVFAHAYAIARAEQGLGYPGAWPDGT